MGTFQERVGVGNPANGEFRWVQTLVDTGATHSMIPASLMEEALQIEPAREIEFTLANGVKQSYGVGEARIRIGDTERTCQVIFGPEGRYLLGATTLQNFELIAETTRHRLIPSPELTI